MLCLLSSWLAHHVFGQMGSPAKVEQTLFIAASLLLVQQFDVVFAAALKGMERFDIAARMEILIRLVTVAACVAAAWLTRDLLVVLLTYLASACFALVFRGVVAGRLVGGFVLLPAWSRERAGEVFSFGMWSSLQGLAAALFQNADRMIIGAYLGAGPVAYFSVCTQLAQQIHTIPAAAMSVLLPLVSRKSAGPAGGLRRVRRLSVLLNFMFAGVLALALFVIGPAFLVWWMGSEFAAQTGNLLTWLVLGYFVLALAVAPHFLLLGRGEARFVSLSNIVGGIATLLSALVLIPVAGLVGAAWSRLAYGPVLAVSFARLYGKTAP